MQSRTVDFLVRLHDLAKECNVDIKRTNSNDVLMVPTYKTNGGLDEWYAIGINPYRQYDFSILTQGTAQK
jgi:hypothetical protein